MQLLFAEDDAGLGTAVTRYFQRQGIGVDWVTTGNQLLALARLDRYACIVLDLGLPELDGDDCLFNLRAHNDLTPVIVQSAQSDQTRKLRLLESGADDYLVKPYDLAELASRVRAVVRRSRATADSGSELPVGDGVLDVNGKCLIREGKRIPLTAKEFTVLMLLMRNRSRVVTRMQLEAAVYGWDANVSSNAIEVHLHNLRRKLPPQLISTVRGMGYQLIDR